MHVDGPGVKFLKERNHSLEGNVKFGIKVVKFVKKRMDCTLEYARHTLRLSAWEWTEQRADRLS